LKNFIQKSFLVFILLFGNATDTIAEEVAPESNERTEQLKTLLFDTLQEIGEEYLLKALDNQDELIEIAQFWLGKEQAQKLAQIALSQVPEEETIFHDIYSDHKEILQVQETLYLDEKLAQFALPQIPEEVTAQLKKYIKAACNIRHNIKTVICNSLLSLQGNNKNGFRIFNKTNLTPYLYSLSQLSRSEIATKIETESLEVQKRLDNDEEETDFLQFDRKETTEESNLEQITALIGNKLAKHYLDYSHPYREYLLAKHNLDDSHPYRKYLKKVKLTLEEESDYVISPEFTEIIEQSGVTKPVFFIDNDRFGSLSNAVLLPKDKYKLNPEKHNPNVLHELGHIENKSWQCRQKIWFMLGIYSNEITNSSLPTKIKLALLMSAGALELALLKLDEYRADSFMLKKATKTQLEYQYQLLSNHAQYHTDSGGKPSKFREFWVNLFPDEHPTSTSRANRIRERIKELAQKDVRQKRQSTNDPH
jgi:hypothetical protein